ncbi:MAG: transglycosylase SLT domain-containing protein [Desulfobacteraceae bacterium]|nr:transglycosylase SLT domain-containing protein [Desulfobacteraceae bacterium]
MKRKKFEKLFFTACIIIIMAGTINAGPLKNMWGELIKKYPPPVPTPEERKKLVTAYNALAKAPEKNVFLEKEVQIDRQERKTVSYPKSRKAGLYQKRLKPYQEMIRIASIRFDVPEAIIGAVIIQESSGNPKAKAKTSSAKGLMQTINATFKFAKGHLRKLGLFIKDPYLPEDSITAGTWYLSYVFELAKQDYPEYNDRKKIEMWRKALEYYYAGPNWGKDPGPIVYARVKGKEIVIKKAWYARKVLEKAYVL